MRWNYCDAWSPCDYINWLGMLPKSGAKEITYDKSDCELTAEVAMAIRNKPGIRNVIFNGPATIVFWDDGTKTVVKTSKKDRKRFDKEKGLAMAICKKMLGNSVYRKTFKTFVHNEEMK